MHFPCWRSGTQCSGYGPCSWKPFIRVCSSFGANQVFDKIVEPSAHSWSALILANAKVSRGQLVFALFQRMQVLGIRSIKHVYMAVLKACVLTSALAQGRSLHAGILQEGLRLDVFLGSTVVNMYAKCGSPIEAHIIFCKLPDKNVVSWNAVIGGYAQHGEGIAALRLLQEMDKEGIAPNKVTFLGALKASSSIGVIEQGRFIHVQIIKFKLGSDVVVGNTLIDMYSKCGSMEEASKVYISLSEKNLVSLNAFIAGYVQHGEDVLALELIEGLQQDNLKPNEVTFLSALKACGNVGALEKGRLMHCLIMASDWTSEAVGNTIVDMYGKCGSCNEAQKVFEKLHHRDIVSWTVMIAGYAQHADIKHALQCFEQMQQEGMKPNEVIFSVILRACGDAGDIDQGRLVHEQLSGCDIETSVAVGTALIDMYAKCGSTGEACKIFDILRDQNLVSWNVMMAGYLQHEEYLSALELFGRMQTAGVKGDDVTFLNVLKACGSIGAIEQGRFIHEKIIRSGFLLVVAVGNAVIDMYAKWGSMDDAQKVFNMLPNRDIISWGTITAGYAHNGNARLTGQCLERMEEEGIMPNEVTFGSILYACSHTGLVDEGLQYFSSMRQNYGISPDIFHCSCMVDLLGRSGFWTQAEIVLQDTMQHNLIGWKSLLSACRRYSNVELGRHCFDHVVHLAPHASAGYLLIANIYGISNIINSSDEKGGESRSAQ